MGQRESAPRAPAPAPSAPAPSPMSSGGGESGGGNPFQPLGEEFFASVDPHREIIGGITILGGIIGGYHWYKIMLWFVGIYAGGSNHYSVGFLRWCEMDFVPPHHFHSESRDPDLSRKPTNTLQKWRSVFGKNDG